VSERGHREGRRSGAGRELLEEEGKEEEEEEEEGRKLHVAVTG
jgi:hypothetical protein